MDDNVVALYTAFDFRWRHDQDPEGLIQLVTNAIKSMLEIRMCKEYGDYSASYYGAFELRAVRDLLWKSTTGCDWDQVTMELGDDEKVFELHHQNSDCTVPDPLWLT